MSDKLTDLTPAEVAKLRKEGYEVTYISGKNYYKYLFLFYNSDYIRLEWCWKKQFN